MPAPPPPRRPLAARAARALVLGVAVSLAVAGLSRTGALAGWESRVADAFVFLRERQPSADIVLVAIDDDAFRALGERQPLSRRYLADLLGLLLESGARVIGLDVELHGATDPAEDRALLAVAARAGGRLVVAGEARPRPGAGPPRYALAPLFAPLPAPVGFANTPVADDGTIRRLLAVLPGEAGPLPSFALAVLAAHAGHGADALARALREGRPLPLPALGEDGRARAAAPLPAPVLAGAALRIDFAGGPGSFVSFPAGPLVALARAGVRPDRDNPFRDRIVLVGATFREARDVHPTPVGALNGVEIHAHMVHTLLARRALGAPPPALNLAALLGACLAVAALSLWLPPLGAALGTAALVAGFAALSYEAYARAGYWLDFVAPVVGMLAYLEGERWLARRRLRRAFGEFVSPEVMRRVTAEGAELGGELRTVSVLMSDVRGFTGLAERRPPAEVSRTMNEYFEAMVDAILAHGGMVQDFIGDGILAVFGAPAEDPRHAWQAVRAAAAMQAALAGLNARWQAAGREPLGMGVAVHTGPVFVGYVGSPRKKKYAALGDTVNTVARLEGLNRDWGTAVLLSAATAAAAGPGVRARPRGTVAVKGRAAPVEVLEFLGLDGAAPAAGGPASPPA
jgi:adenylate cyclase